LDLAINVVLTIRQTKNITVYKGHNQFLFVKRKIGMKVLSQFYRNEELIFESSLFTIFLKQIVDIKYQNLSHPVSLERNRGWYYSLLYDDTVLDIKVKYFRRPAFKLFENGSEIGSIGNPKFLAIESRYYEMNTGTDDETINLYFLILFLAQLRGF
jgi:hypothetical protein